MCPRGAPTKTGFLGAVASTVPTLCAVTVDGWHGVEGRQGGGDDDGWRRHDGDSDDGWDERDGVPQEENGDEVDGW